MAILRSAAPVLAALALGLPGCSRGGREAEVRPPAALLVEATAQAGLPVATAPWPDGLYRIPEISPGGVALFDFDEDGDLDIYQVCHPPPPRPEEPAPNRLFRQEAGGRFVEVPRAAGLDDPGYGNGVALGDADGDGHLDVFIANLGRDALYLARGDGSFRPASGSGIVEDRWSSSAAFLDYDRDGDLDLYVTRYLEDDPSRVCSPGAGQPRDYCGPSRYQGVPDLLFRNKGDGAFEDRSRAAGISDTRPGFGLVCVDLNGDGWTDIFVANDMQPNLLYMNNKDGTFTDRALELGAAVNGAGRPQAGMGVAVGDVDGDLQLDLFVTNLADQTNTLYLRDRDGRFVDRSASSGVGAPSLPFTGWGCALADLDLDGDLDLAVVNGRIERGPVRAGSERLGPFWSPYAEPSGLYLNQGAGRFIEGRAAGGDFAGCVEVTRALAAGDLDGDGAPDLVTSNVARQLRVYRGRPPAPGRHWLSVRALRGKRDALGALVVVEAGGRKQLRPILGTSGFQSAQEPVAHFGLGEAARADGIEVSWPDGSQERFPGTAADRRLTLREGEGVKRGSGGR